MNDSSIRLPITIAFDNPALIPGSTYTARVKTVTDSLESPYYTLNFTMGKSIVYKQYCLFSDNIHFYLCVFVLLRCMLFIVRLEERRKTAVIFLSVISNS